MTVAMRDLLGVIAARSGGGGGELGCITESFSSLSSYSTVSGNRSLYSIVSDGDGSALDYSPVSSGTVSAIERTFAARPLATLSVKFKLTTLAADDACILMARGNGSSVLYFNPRRESFYDALRRPWLVIGADVTGVADAALSVDTWYQLDVSIASGSGNSTFVLTDLDASSEVKSGACVGNHSPTAVDALRFLDDAVLGSSGTRYDAISLCPT